MDISVSTWWWIAAGLVVAAELVTGTFYLLMIALGLGAAALAAHLGMGVTGQFLAAAVVGGGSVAAWHARRRAGQQPLPAQANPDINLDIGQRVTVEHWNTDRTARVFYRGASWSVRFGGTGEPAPGEHVIRAIDGSHLVVER